jgi:NAD+ synthase
MNVRTVIGIKPAATLEHLRTRYRDYMRLNGLKTAVLGISGGVDSALVAAIVHGQGYPLIGVSLPSPSNTEEENLRADMVGQTWCDKYIVQPIDQLVHDMLNGINLDIPTGDDEAKARQERENKIRIGNVKARIRMILLYDWARREGGLVLGTDNYTEYLLGFWTLHGDVGDLSLIQNLWKTEVYDLAMHIANKELGFTDGPSKRQALNACRLAIPTDGLGITKSDLEQIGCESYREVDEILRDAINGGPTDVHHPVVRRHMATAYKRDNPYNIGIREEVFTRA